MFLQHHFKNKFFIFPHWLMDQCGKIKTCRGMLCVGYSHHEKSLGNRQCSRYTTSPDKTNFNRVCVLFRVPQRRGRPGAAVTQYLWGRDHAVTALVPP